MQDLTDPQQWNAYSYCGNDPVSQSDPTGLRGDDLYYGPVGAQKKENQLIGAGVGIVAFAGCTALTGGIGTVGCMAVGAAAANLTTNALDGDIRSAQDVAESLVVGGVQGALAVPLAAVDMASQAEAIKTDIQEGDVAGALGHGALGALDAVTVVGGVKLLGGKGRCLNSFAPATVVLMAGGDTKRIADIKVGDEVVATDPETGTTTTEQVEVLHDNLDNDLIDLTVPLPDGRSSVIKTTQHHPFWDQTTATWVHAGDLETGHRLRDASGSDSVTVTAVRQRNGAQHMLNLTVAELHTYYVLAGKTPVLVHNDGGGRLRPDYDAEGPHSTFLRDGTTGQIKKWATWIPQTNPRNPAPWVMVERFDLQGPAHINRDGTRVPTPHINLPNGGDARPAQRWEIPGSGASRPSPSC